MPVLPSSTRVRDLKYRMYQYAALLWPLCGVDWSLTLYLSDFRLLAIPEPDKPKVRTSEIISRFSSNSRVMSPQMNVCCIRLLLTQMRSVSLKT